MKRALFVLVLSLLGACGGTVDVPGASSSSTGTGGGSTTGTGGACPGSPILCAQGCGSDYFPAQATCVGSTWICPQGTVDPATCPSGTCWGLPLPCETCSPTGWACLPQAACMPASCNGLICAECPKEILDPIVLGACACICDAAGQTTCSLAPGCCNTDSDCGDKTLFPCVAHVCKQPVPDACWSNAECAPGLICVGATVCPCGALCDDEDHPGACVPG